MILLRPGVLTAPGCRSRILNEIDTTLMSYLTNNDNIYKIGTTIFAKSKPDVALVIMKYYHRTYYCVDVSDPTGRQYEFFEKDLLPARRKAA